MTGTTRDIIHNGTVEVGRTTSFLPWGQSDRGKSLCSDTIKVATFVNGKVDAEVKVTGNQNENDVNTYSNDKVKDAQGDIFKVNNQIQNGQTDGQNEGQENQIQGQNAKLDENQSKVKAAKLKLKEEAEMDMEDLDAKPQKNKFKNIWQSVNVIRKEPEVLGTGEGFQCVTIKITKTHKDWVAIRDIVIETG